MIFDIEKINLKYLVVWNKNRPVEFSVHKWRRDQVYKFLTVKPDTKVKNVKEWVESHIPDPWPEANHGHLKRMVQKLNRSQKMVWDSRKPKEISLQN